MGCSFTRVAVGTSYVEGMNTRSLFRSFVNAFSGLSFAFRSQRNLRIQIALGSFLLFYVFSREFSAENRAFFVLLVSLVLAFELLNTAMERLADIVSPDLRPAVRQVKDVSAAAVLLVVAAAVFSGALFLL